MLDICTGGAPFGNIHNLKWTPEQDAALARNREAGYSGSQSAALINSEFQTAYTRNAIIGRLHRLGITERISPLRVRRILEPRPAKGPTGPRQRKPPALPVEIVTLQCVEIIPRNLSLAELGPRDCRYPYGDDIYTFCGHPKTEGSSYCFAHFHLTRGEGRTRARSAANIASKLIETAWS